MTSYDDTYLIISERVHENIPSSAYLGCAGHEVSHSCVGDAEQLGDLLHYGRVHDTYSNTLVVGGLVTGCNETLKIDLLESSEIELEASQTLQLLTSSSDLNCICPRMRIAVRMLITCSLSLGASPSSTRLF